MRRRVDGCRMCALCRQDMMRYPGYEEELQQCSMPLLCEVQPGRGCAGQRAITRTTDCQIPADGCISRVTTLFFFCIVVAVVYHLQPFIQFQRDDSDVYYRSNVHGSQT